MTFAPITIAYPLAIVVIVGDLVSRDKKHSGQQARTKDDRGSTTFMTLSFVCAIALVPILTTIDLLRIQYVILGWIGLAIMIVGIGIRVWARIILGRFYSIRLQTTEKQPIVTQGPYASVRHPGYLGYLLMWTGLAIASLNGLVILVIIPLMSSAYGYRIRNEEGMLVATSGTIYEEYKKRTKRLIPYIY